MLGSKPPGCSGNPLRPVTTKLLTLPARMRPAHRSATNAAASSRARSRAGLITCGICGTDFEPEEV